MHRCLYNLSRRRRVDYYLKQRRKFRRFSRIGVRYTPSWSTLSVSVPALMSSSSFGSNEQNPLAQQFYHKGFPHKELYEIIFEKQTVTGRYAYTSTSQPVKISSYSKLGAVPMDDSDFEPDPDWTTGEKRPNTFGHGKARNRRNKSSSGQSLADAIFRLTDELAEKWTMGSRASNRSADEREEENASAPSNLFFMSNCIDIMQVPTQFYLLVVTYLYENPGWWEIFVKFPLEEKANWIYNNFPNK